MTIFDFFYILIRGGDTMVMAYVVLIIETDKKFSSVPAKLQAQVRETLRKMGLDENGNPIVEEEAPAEA